MEIYYLKYMVQTIVLPRELDEWMSPN